MEDAFRCRNISNRTEITRSFLHNRVNGRILRTVGLDSALKTACIAFGVSNAIEIAFKRRNISNKDEYNAQFVVKIEYMVAFCAQLGLIRR